MSNVKQFFKLNLKYIDILLLNTNYCYKQYYKRNRWGSGSLFLSFNNNILIFVIDRFLRHQSLLSDSQWRMYGPLLITECH